MNFTLKPFEAPGSSFPFRVSGTIYRTANILTVTYVLDGRLEGLVIPAQAGWAARRHGLWEETCFEVFIAAGGSPAYWEFNLSPSGHWNVYRFEAYRWGMQEETAFASLPFSLLNRPDSLLLTAAVALDGMIPADQPLKAAVSSVVRHRDGTVSHWALVHGGPRADFHRRDGFVVGL